jgi:tetratricopeptide (TPR) repeat protein
MNWNPEEKENLIKLLLSVDHSNRTLALELLNQANECDDFATPLFFLDACIYDIKQEAGFNLVLNKISLEKQAFYNDTLGFFKNLYYLNKKELQDSLALYEERLASEFEKLFKLATQYSHIYNSLGNNLISLNLKKKGLEYLKKAVEYNPESYSNNFDFAYNLNESKKNALTIIQHYKKCITIKDNGIGPYHNIGRIYAHQLGEYSLALEVMKEGISKYPYADTMIEMALAEENLGNLPEAREYLLMALKTDPDSNLAHNNLAFMLWKYFKEFDLAKSHINAAIKLKSREGLYWHTLAEVEWYGFKNKELALEALYKAKEVQKSYRGGDEMIAELEAF